LKNNLSLVIFLKGIAMGIADVIPGVSGGTVAFISGIYDELVSTVSNLKPRLIVVLFKQGFKAFWTELNGRFLLPLLAGIVTAIFSLAYLITQALEHFPVVVWAFFFGLVLASIPLVVVQITGFRSVANLLLFTVGAFGAYLISRVSPAAGSESLIYIFFCACVAICAMILPGISGSFVLLLLGAYTTVLGSVTSLISGLKAMDMAVMLPALIMVVVFVSGCLVGLVSFSSLLKWLLNRHRNATLSVLAGFLLGSLFKLWPWRVATETFIKHAGTEKEEIVTLKESLVMPPDYGSEPMVMWAIVAFLLGLAVIYLLHRFSKPVINA